MALRLEPLRVRVDGTADLVAHVLQLERLLERLEVLVEVRNMGPTHGYIVAAGGKCVSGACRSGGHLKREMSPFVAVGAMKDDICLPC